jgi:hypothetical protein
VAHRLGQALCYWLLTKTGQVIARTTVQKMTDDLITPVVQQEIENFDKTIAELVPLTVIKGENEPYLFQGDYNDYDPSCDLPFDPASSMPEQDKYPDEDSYDQYLTAQVLLPRGDAYKKGTVI